MLKVYLYKFNLQFMYRVLPHGFDWWTDQGEYVGRTYGQDTHAIHALLDSYIREIKGWVV